MTHAQKDWTASNMLSRFDDVSSADIRHLRDWMKSESEIPQNMPDEQLLLFIHSNYSNMEETKTCMQRYYYLKRKAQQLFIKRDFTDPELRRMMDTVYCSILPVKTPKNYGIVFHKLNNTDPSKYDFNYSFKFFMMTIDLLYAMEGPQTGLIILFDMTGVKFGHVTRLPLNSVRRSLEYIQEALPVRLKGIHVLNVHPVIDKIMFIIKPFIKKSLLDLLHFHKEGDEEVYNVVPKSCLPKDYDGELDTVQHYHDELVVLMEKYNPCFQAEEEMLKAASKKSGKKVEADISLSRLDID